MVELSTRTGETNQHRYFLSSGSEILYSGYIAVTVVVGTHVDDSNRIPRCDFLFSRARLLLRRMFTTHWFICNGSIRGGLFASFYKWLTYKVAVRDYVQCFSNAHVGWFHSMCYRIECGSRSTGVANRFASSASCGMDWAATEGEHEAQVCVHSVRAGSCLCLSGFACIGQMQPLNAVWGGMQNHDCSRRACRRCIQRP